MKRKKKKNIPKIIIIFSLLIFLYFFCINDYNLKKNNLTTKKVPKGFSTFDTIIKIDKNKELNKTTLTNNISKIQFNEKINEQYLYEQNYFCTHQKKFYNKEFEEKIKKTDVNILGKRFDMFIYEKSDYVSKWIKMSKSWERAQTTELLKALKYYSNKKNISNHNIYILDIGANIGWYTIVFGKYGYNVISFEPSKLNNYIIKKNYCLNKDINILIINKGLYTEERICDLYYSIYNKGNGMIICNEQNEKISKFVFKNKSGEIVLTKLSNYIPFLSDKNLALIKIDSEGTEGKIIESGIELITKYHVPFIFLEFTPKYLNFHGTNPKEFLQLFINNGYHINLFGFFSKKNISVDILIDKLNKTKYVQMNLYIIHSNFTK